jgi:hypothetical protein
LKIIVSHSAFKQTLKLYFENGEMPTKENIVEIMKKSKLHKVGSDSTYFSLTGIFISEEHQQ